MPCNPQELSQRTEEKDLSPQLWRHEKFPLPANSWAPDAANHGKKVMVGAIGFEPTTCGSQNRRAARLRHAP